MKPISEKEVNLYFHKYRNYIFKVLGHRKTTNTDDLNYLGRNLIGKKYFGTFSQDKVPINALKGKERYFIINTDPSSKLGEHWVAIYKSKSDIYYIYDTYGRPAKKILRILINQLGGAKLRYRESNPDKEQIGYTSSHCGQSCTSFLCCVKKLGIKNALKI